MDETRQRQLCRSTASAHGVGGLEDDDFATRLRDRNARSQPVRAGAHDDGVDGHTASIGFASEPASSISGFASRPSKRSPRHNRYFGHYRFHYADLFSSG